MPVTFGGTIHISDVTAVVEHDAPLLTLEPLVIGDVELAIRANCAGLIRDGDTLQLGIGAIPDAVLRFLGDKKDLGNPLRDVLRRSRGAGRSRVITNRLKKDESRKIRSQLSDGNKGNSMIS